MTLFLLSLEMMNEAMKRENTDSRALYSCEQFSNESAQLIS